MPSFGSLGSDRIRAVVAYLRLLQGRTAATYIPGDAANGETLFYGTARCSECHSVNGKGGFIAGDLSKLGGVHSAEEIRAAIVQPDDSSRRGAMVVVTTREGQKYSGVARNEDNFSIQLQTQDGAFHLFLKSEIDSAIRQPGSLMPADYGSILSPAAVNDLIGFLLSASNESKAAVASSGASKRKQPQEQ